MFCVTKKAWTKRALLKNTDKVVSEMRISIKNTENSKTYPIFLFFNKHRRKILIRTTIILKIICSMQNLSQRGNCIWSGCYIQASRRNINSWRIRWLSRETISKWACCLSLFILTIQDIAIFASLFLSQRKKRPLFLFPVYYHLRKKVNET